MDTTEPYFTEMALSFGSTLCLDIVCTEIIMNLTLNIEKLHVIMDDNGGFNYVSIHVLVLSNDYTHLSTITIHTRHMEVRRACSLTCYYV